MELIPGAIVRSTAGRDRFRVFAVVEIDPGNMTAPVVVSDGRLHPLKQRKHKNPAHLSLLCIPGENDREKLKSGVSDGEIAEICHKYEKLPGNRKKPLDKGLFDEL